VALEKVEHVTAGDLLPRIIFRTASFDGIAIDDAMADYVTLAPGTIPLDPPPE